METTLATPPQPSSTAPPAAPAAIGRIFAIDGYRGLVMFLMMAEVMRLGLLAKIFPDAGWARAVAFHTDHVAWVGCSLHDLIQPSFSFLVGAAMVFSLAKRREHGAPFWKSALHALWRAFFLCWLGIFLRSMDGETTNFTFEDTLTQIGLGYFVLFLLAHASTKVQWWSFGVLLAGYWLAFLLYPAPGKDFDWASSGVPADWAHHQAGLAAHWDLNSNAAWAVDKWFMNLFPRPEPFVYNEGGYSTLSFVPTLATMLLGLLAGGVLKSDRSNKQKLGWLATAAVIAWGLGIAWHYGQCPIVKRIWTPSWTLFSGGSCLAFLAFFFAIMEMAKWRKWAMPLNVIGANSIVAYCIAHLWHPFLHHNWRVHAGRPFEKYGEHWEIILEGTVVFLFMWLFLFWMWRRKVFVRI